MGINIDKQYLIETLGQLIGIDSTLPHETKISEFIADQLRAFGVEPEWHEVAPGRPNVYATTEMGRENDFWFSQDTPTPLAWPRAGRQTPL